ncbi:hypothetical protein [Micromonospora zamorensis]|uniref:hypothetical protein n=1 Tax=Micromonospora zamorensis TaxID=709883 RepID=UPI002E2BFC9D|nr:hypothetical protein [Micromonospora zamorensis]
MPGVDDPDALTAWVDLHLRFGITPHTPAAVTTLKIRFGADAHALAQLARLDAGAP